MYRVILITTNNITATSLHKYRNFREKEEMYLCPISRNISVSTLTKRILYEAGHGLYGEYVVCGLFIALL
jgi:hypothetical protein